MTTTILMFLSFYAKTMYIFKKCDIIYLKERNKQKISRRMKK